MSLWIENPTYVGYYSGDHYVAFREDGANLVAEVGPLLSSQRSLATIAHAVFKKYPIPPSIQHSMKLSVQRLLQEGRAFSLKKFNT